MYTNLSQAPLPLAVREQKEVWGKVRGFRRSQFLVMFTKNVLHPHDHPRPARFFGVRAAGLRLAVASIVCLRNTLVEAGLEPASTNAVKDIIDH